MEHYTFSISSDQPLELYAIFFKKNYLFIFFLNSAGLCVVCQYSTLDLFVGCTSALFRTSCTFCVCLVLHVHGGVDMGFSYLLYTFTSSRMPPSSWSARASGHTPVPPSAGELNCVKRHWSMDLDRCGGSSTSRRCCM